MSAGPVGLFSRRWLLRQGATAALAWIAASRRRPLVGTVLAAGRGRLGLPVPLQSRDQWKWFQVDAHVHSSVSSDAMADLGILAGSATALGYDAVFVTDHNQASSFSINSNNANSLVLADNYSLWERGSSGEPAYHVLKPVRSPVASGTKSLYMLSSSTRYAEAFIWKRRGANLRSGNITLSVSFYPTRLDPDCGFYVSVTLGGDPAIAEPLGYTTRKGDVAPGKSIVLVWQAGTPRASRSDAQQRVFVYDLGAPTLNAWNRYTINVTEALRDIPPDELPVDYEGLAHLKIAVASKTGIAEGYTDAYSLQVSKPRGPAEEFVHRNAFIAALSTPQLRLYPAVELGQTDHVQRFDFAIHSPSAFVDYQRGVDGIRPTQESGYPVMLNHPGYPGGVSVADAIETGAFGADLIEVREATMVSAWEGILSRGIPIPGVWSTDTHASFSRGSPSARVFSRSPALDDLLRSMFEGRLYNVLNHFDGHVVLNLDPRSDQPHPSRYPVFVGAGREEVRIHLLVTGGMDQGWTVRWLRDGKVVHTEAVSSSSYEATRAFALAGTSTFVRAEVLDATGELHSMTQAILFQKIASLPDDISLCVDEIKTADGRQYTTIATRGVTDASWDATRDALNLRIENPLAALASIVVATPRRPVGVMVDGERLPQASTLADFLESTTSSWFAFAERYLLYLKVAHDQPIHEVTAAFRHLAARDTRAPTRPSLQVELQADRRALLTWTASEDNELLAGYRIRRNRRSVATVGPRTTRYVDASLASSRSYRYWVEAVDASGNVAVSNAVLVRTPRAPITIRAVADAYVTADEPTTPHGKADVLRIDSDPEVTVYLRFVVPNFGGSLKRATLKMLSHSASHIGCDVRAVADNAWDEASLTFGNAPAVSPIVLSSSGGFEAGRWVDIDVSQAVRSDGTLSLALTTDSTGSIAFASRESGHSPKLVIEPA